MENILTKIKHRMNVDSITYHLYDSEGNRVTNAILDRKNWRSASILENEEEFK